MTVRETKVLRLGGGGVKVLAWVSLVIQGIVGIMLLVTGGEPVLIGGLDIPARGVGLLNLLAAVVYFFMFLLLSAVMRLLLELHARSGA